MRKVSFGYENEKIAAISPEHATEMKVIFKVLLIVSVRPRIMKLKFAEQISLLVINKRFSRAICNISKLNYISLWREYFWCDWIQRLS